MRANHPPPEREARVQRSVQRTLLAALAALLALAFVGAVGPDPPGRLARSSIQGPADPPWAIDLATAPAWQLTLLPGIGASRAQAIVSRRTRGEGEGESLGLGTWQDLLAVPGIGPGIVERLRSPGLPVRVLWRGRPLPTMDP